MGELILEKQALGVHPTGAVEDEALGDDAVWYNHTMDYGTLIESQPACTQLTLEQI